MKRAEGLSLAACPMCGGSGQVTKVTNSFLGQMRSTSICPQCKGYGKVVDKIPAGANKDGMKSVEETIKIKIPTGVEDGNYMTLDSQGNEDINGQAGDLYVFFEEESHEFFSRYGNDVLLQVVLGYSQAVFGDKIDIPTINGTAKLKIPSGIQPGQILRVKGKGFPLIGKSRRGDQLVKIQIDVPSKLNRDEKKSTEDLLRIQKNKEIKSLYLYPDSYISTMISSSTFESFVVVKASCNSGSKLSPTLPNGLTPLDSSFLLKSSFTSKRAFFTSSCL